RLDPRARPAQRGDLAGAALAHHDGEPLSRSAGGNGPVLGTDMSDEGVVDDHGEVARHLQLVAAADADAVDAGERRLADLPQAVVHVLEGTEPLPVLAGLAEVVLAPRLEVGAAAKRADRAGENDK